jgi:hypothetical protein
MNYTCNCESGYDQSWNKDTDELVCGNINDCGSEACGIGRRKDLVNGYQCICPTGYEEVGELDAKTLWFYSLPSLIILAQPRQPAGPAICAYLICSS